MIISLFFITGCFKEDNLENVTIYTTDYATEYITEQLYGNNANILSIYPNNIVINDYKLTDKQLTDYSKASIYIYNGLSNEKNYAKKMLNKNKNLLIIDATMSMEYTNNVEELWLDPSNFLMMAQNIKNGFKEYITSTYLKLQIDEKYENLKINISEVDAELKLIASNASNKNVIVSNDLLLYLNKYGLNVISLEENDNLTAKSKADAEKLISNGTVKFIINKDNEKLNETISALVKKYNLTLLNFNTGSNLSEEQRMNKVDFIQIMNDNIDLLKQELYQ